MMEEFQPLMAAGGGFLARRTRCALAIYMDLRSEKQGAKWGAKKAASDNPVYNIAFPGNRMK